MHDILDTGAEILQTSSQGFVFHLGRFSPVSVSAGQLDKSQQHPPVTTWLTKVPSHKCLGLQHLFGLLVKRKDALGGKYGVL